MAVVIHRLTKEINFSAHTPDFNPAVWVVYSKLAAQPKINALRTLLLTISPRHVKFDGSDNPLEMTAPEKLSVDNQVQRLEMVSDQPLDVDGVPGVNGGLGIHTITVRKRNLSGALVPSGTQTIRITSSGSAPISLGTVVLVAGEATFTVGPVGATFRGEVMLRAFHPAVALLEGELKIRFR